MKFANVRELKNKTSEVLRVVDHGEDVIVTSRGKPRALISHFTEDELEDYVLLHHPRLKARIEEAYKDYLKGRGVDLNTLIFELEKEIGKV